MFGERLVVYTGSMPLSPPLHLSLPTIEALAHGRVVTVGPRPLGVRPLARLFKAAPRVEPLPPQDQTPSASLPEEIYAPSAAPLITARASCRPPSPGKPHTL